MCPISEIEVSISETQEWKYLKVFVIIKENVHIKTSDAH